MKKKRYNVVSKAVTSPAKLARHGVAAPTNLLKDVGKGLSSIGKFRK